MSNLCYAYVYMNWDTKRKLLYALSLTVVISALIVLTMYDTLFPAPRCNDGKQNGYETGVDCGGGCALRCTQEVSPLSVVWAKSVRSGKNLYDLVALVSNANIDNASQELKYTFTLYDDVGKVLGSLSGTTVAPLDGKFPIIMQNVPLAKAPKNVVATLTDGPHFTVEENPTSPTVRVLARRYEEGSIPRVYTTIANTKRVEINNLPVRVLLFDAFDNVYAVGQTIVPVLPKEGVQELIMTWNEPFNQKPVRIEVYPIFNPFEAIGY